MRNQNKTAIVAGVFLVVALTSIVLPLIWTWRTRLVLPALIDVSVSDMARYLGAAGAVAWTVYTLSVEGYGTVKNGLNKTEALFYLVRNGFAHGGFLVCEYNRRRYYVFESRDRGKLKGRAVLSEETLLSWMKVIKAGYPKRT
ncbi:hypothetical protein [Adlercreutzia aquisgranensis]|uniref:hypothetical protein n=1 Tax=Adlercreutzia aquisgranensis TaxID=2941323 RepID=UPI0020410DFF|nr:hypothetical protein [Adlercreutzia aquisgranensis]